MIEFKKRSCARMRSGIIISRIAQKLEEEPRKEFPEEQVFDEGEKSNVRS